MNHDDFNQYFGQTYTRLADGSLVYIYGSNGDNARYAALIPPPDQPFWLNENQLGVDKNVKEMPIDDFLKQVNKEPGVMGFHRGMGNSVFFLEMVPKRQNKKALAWDRLLLSVPNKNEAKEALTHVTGLLVQDIEQYYRYVPIQVMWQAYHPSYTPFEEALANLESGESLGEPLEENLALITRSNWKYPALVYKTRPIGIVSADTVRLFEGFGEYGDYLKRSNSSIREAKIQVEKGI